LNLTPNFKASEYECQCGRFECTAPEMNKYLTLVVQAIRDELKRPLTITSGARCDYWNTKIGGSKNSLHKYGLAVDILAENSQARYDIIRAAIGLGIIRIGVGEGFIHLDLGKTKALWTY